MKKLGLLSVAVPVASQAVVVREASVLNVHSMPVKIGDVLVISNCMTASVRGVEQTEHGSFYNQDGGGGDIYSRPAPGIVLRL